MKKVLMLMRHGKSDRNLGARDFDRPLNQRGEKDTKNIGVELKNKNLVPDLIISSPAERAKKTAENVSSKSTYGKEIVWEESFYFGYNKKLIKEINSIKDEVHKVLIVGHNPTWSDMTEFFSGKYFDMKTANVCILEFEGSWKDLKEQKCVFKEVISPKDLQTLSE